MQVEGVLERCVPLHSNRMEGDRETRVARLVGMMLEFEVFSVMFIFSVTQEARPSAEIDGGGVSVTGVWKAGSASERGIGPGRCSLISRQRGASP